ncbi:MAG TPA: hypothetical protein VM778_09225 [Gemmatimonadota bacterium]|nr:hypothetical protein [Gemmatimonadota bacterium]
MNSHVDETRRSRGRFAAGALALAVVAALSAPEQARAQASPWSYNQDLHLTYEFDDNVNEATGATVSVAQTDPIRAQVAKLAYRGDLEWGGGEQRLSFTFHGGYKRHFGLVDDGPAQDEAEAEGELDVSSQLVSEGSLNYTRRVTDDFAVSARAGIKDRRWTEDEFFFINEDAFRRYSTGVSGIVNLEPLIPDRSAFIEAGARFSDIEFRNLDQLFGNETVGGHVFLIKEYGHGIEATWSYSYDRVRYSGRGKLEPGDDPSGILGPTRARQEDRLHDLGVEVRWFGTLGVVADYNYRYNDSNSFGFSWYSHNVGLQLLHQGPWGLFVHASGQLELRSFTEPVPSITAGSLDIGEAENNLLLFRVVKDVTPAYSVEARYARYRNESITLNDFYSKNIYAVGVTYRP